MEMMVAHFPSLLPSLLGEVQGRWLRSLHSLTFWGHSQPPTASDNSSSHTPPLKWWEWIQEKVQTRAALVLHLFIHQAVRHGVLRWADESSELKTAALIRVFQCGSLAQLRGRTWMDWSVQKKNNPWTWWKRSVHRMSCSEGCAWHFIFYFF